MNESTQIKGGDNMEINAENHGISDTISSSDRETDKKIEIKDPKKREGGKLNIQDKLCTKVKL